MNMDIWYDLLVRELTPLDRATELRQDAQQQVPPDYAEDEAPTLSNRRTSPSRASTPYPSHGTASSQS